jgi:hypothetical protein
MRALAGTAFAAIPATKRAGEDLPRVFEDP